MLSTILAAGVSTGGGKVTAATEISGGDWLVLGLFVGGALFISFMCSLLEAVVMSVDIYKLTAMAKNQDSGAQRMLKIKENTEDSIAAILTLNTVAHTVGATLSGAQALKMFGSEAMGLFSGILTFLILVLTEIIPKNAGERYPEKFSNFASVVLTGIIVVMYPLVKANRFLVLLLYGEHHEVMERSTVDAIHDKAFEDGAIDEEEKRRISRVLGLAEKTVHDIQVVDSEMPTITADSTIKELSEPGCHSLNTRVLVQGNGPEDILGYVYLEEAFRSVLTGRNTMETKLSDAFAVFNNDNGLQPLVRKVATCRGDVPAKKLFRSMLKRGLQIVVVLDSNGMISGMVTLEEFLEDLLDQDIRDEDDPLEQVETT